MAGPRALLFFAAVEGRSHGHPEPSRRSPAAARSAPGRHRLRHRDGAASRARRWPGGGGNAVPVARSVHGLGDQGAVHVGCRAARRPDARRHGGARPEVLSPRAAGGRPGLCPHRLAEPRASQWRRGGGVGDGRGAGAGGPPDHAGGGAVALALSRRARHAGADRLGRHRRSAGTEARPHAGRLRGLRPGRRHGRADRAQHGRAGCRHRRLGREMPLCCQ